MVIGKTYNPGSVHVRLGEANSAYDAAAWAGHLAQAANALRTIRTYVGVFMTITQQADYEKIRGYAEGDEREDYQVFDDMENRREFLLRIARTHGIYAKAEEEWGDASTLDEEIPDA